MAIFNLNFFDLGWISTDDPDGFSDNGGYQFNWGVSTVTITPGASEQVVSIEDNVDTNFDDDQDANQVLNGPATLNGITYPDNTWIQSEYMIFVQDSLGNTYDLQFVSAGTDAYNIVGFVIQGAVPPFGEALTVMSTADFPSSSYAYATSAPACFGRKTRVATARGHVRAMDLRPGDVAIMADGSAASIALILSSPLAGTDTALIRIRRDAFGPGMPMRDLVLSPQHRVWVPVLGALVPARALTALPRVGTVAPDADEVLIHVVLARHGVLLAEGVACESFWPGPMAMAGLPAPARFQVRRIMGRDPVPAAPMIGVQAARRRLAGECAVQAAA